MTESQSDDSRNRLDRIEAVLETMGQRQDAIGRQQEANSRQIAANTENIAQLMEGQRMLLQMFSQHQDDMREFRQTTNRTLDRMEATQREQGQQILTLQQQVATMQQQVATLQDQVGTIQDQVGTVQDQVATVQDQVAILQQQTAGILEYLFKQQNNGGRSPQS